MLRKPKPRWNRHHELVSGDDVLAECWRDMFGEWRFLVRTAKGWLRYPKKEFRTLADAKAAAEKAAVRREQR